MATESPDILAMGDPSDGRVSPAAALAGQDRASGLKRSLIALEGCLAAALRWIMFLSILTLSLTMVAQVVMRYVLEWPFLGIEEMAPLLALWGYFAGMIYSTRHRSHIEGGVMNLITENPLVLGLLRLLGTVVSLVALCIFFYYAYTFVQFNMDIGR